MNTKSIADELSQATNGINQARLNYIQAILSFQTALYRSTVSMSLNPLMALNSFMELSKFQVQEGGKSQEAKATSTS
jgi:hypothetical protein